MSTRITHKLIELENGMIVIESSIPDPKNYFNPAPFVSEIKQRTPLSDFKVSELLSNMLAVHERDLIRKVGERWCEGETFTS
jgi:hypothetical protein